MGLLTRFLLLLLSLCPTVHMSTRMASRQDPDDDEIMGYAGYVDDSDLDQHDDWPSQEALESHMTLAFLEHCFSLEPSKHDH
jgi:hypothetical protein